MTMQDQWLIERARARKTAADRGHQLLETATPAVDDLWSRLQRETERLVAVFLDALGDPGALVVETSPDAIDLKRPDGRQLTLQVDRERRRLTQTVRDGRGAIRRPKPIIHFVTDGNGEVTFNFGGVQGAAASLLRRIT